MKNLKEIAKLILENGNDVVGIRGLDSDEQYKIGDTCRESYEWDLEADCSTYFTTGETAGGTCATYIDTDNVYFINFDDDDIDELVKSLEKSLAASNGYGTRKAVIVGTRFNTDGLFDPEEVRIEDAQVLALL